MSKRDPNVVHVKDLDAIKIGDTDAARMAYRLLKGLDGDASEALIRAGRMLHVSPWTVYNWLRGKASPRAALRHALEDLVERVEAAA